MARLDDKAKTKTLSIRVKAEYYKKFKEEVELLGTNNSEQLWDRITQGGLEDKDFFKTGEFLQVFQDTKQHLVALCDVPNLSDEVKNALNKLVEKHTEVNSHIEDFEAFASTKAIKKDTMMMSYLLQLTDTST